ncbi:MAG TPA: c-type cytochrome domain-containing protein, partial [Bacteroidota bacterium]|nr:c-type cytochrome domain-containing protein [Bacteroidota bacterium]
GCNVRRFGITYLITGICIAMALLSSCKDDNTVNNLNDIVFPDSNISYDRTIQPLFNIACTYSGCHDTKTMAGNLDLTTFSGIRQRYFDVVIPRDTTLSHLVWRIDGKYGLTPMPPTRALTLNQRQGLKKWILEGATDTVK